MPPNDTAPVIVNGPPESSSIHGKQALVNRVTLRCPFCGTEGKLGKKKVDFVVYPFRCGCGHDTLTLPDGSAALQHRKCGRICIKPLRSRHLKPYSISSDKRSLQREAGSDV